MTTTDTQTQDGEAGSGRGAPRRGRAAEVGRDRPPRAGGDRRAACREDAGGDGRGDARGREQEAGRAVRPDRAGDVRAA